MRRRSTLLPIALLALATASAGPTTAPTTVPADPAKAGERLAAELGRRYAIAVKDVDDNPHNELIRMTTAMARERQAWADLVRPLTTEQCDDLIAYASVAKDGGGDRVAEFAVTRAVQDGNPDVLKRLLANVWVDEVDGRFTEWMLEKQTGRSVEILAAAYRATPSHAQAETLAGVFRRAFSQVDGDHLTDDGYVDKCDRFRRGNAGLRLNDHYQLPPVANPPAVVRPAAPDPDAGMLFRE